jgi:hypothetical protein
VYKLSKNLNVLLLSFSSKFLTINAAPPPLPDNKLSNILPAFSLTMFEGVITLPEETAVSTACFPSRGVCSDITLVT